jgi:hypothetical protein
VDLATQPQLTFSTGVCGSVPEIAQLAATFFSRRDSRLQCGTRTKAGVRHSQWFEDVLLCKLIQRHPTGARYDFT